MATKAESWLVFIDTNIMLDFYRLPGESAERQILALQKHLDSIIVTEQVQMEFLKNRQKVVAESISKLAAPSKNVQLPMIVSDLQASGTLASRLKDASDAHKKIEQKVVRILEEPSKHDPVYRGLKKLFEYRSPLNLRRPEKLRFSIRNRARKRFYLGYPPRKSGDTSIGDALNWEWIIHCAKESKEHSHILIVSRDGDYGVSYKKNTILNDWLEEEFKKRVSRKRKIELTNKLSDALRVLDETVNQEDENAEVKLIHSALKNEIFSNYLKFNLDQFDMKANEELVKVLREMQIRNFLIPKHPASEGDEGEGANEG